MLANYGEVSEWSKELASKASSPLRGSWVRIPPSPPFLFSAEVSAFIGLGPARRELSNRVRS